MKRLNEKNKIGVLTFHNADNYGAILQNYALQKTIKNMNYEVDTIDYHCAIIEDSYKIWPQLPKNMSLKRKIVATIWKLWNLPKTIIRKHRFSYFRKCYISLSNACTKSNVKTLTENYSLILCGSDQVWNEDLVKEEMNVYSLGFISSIKKASYAASAGTNEITDKTLLDNIKSLDYITVREKSLENYLYSQKIQGNTVCDPVFLLNRQEWLQLVDKKKKKDYMFVYYLDSQKEVVELATYISKEKSLPICHPGKFFPKNRKLNSFKYGHGPLEFVADIALSKMCVVSSFHGLVYSLIFEKEFFVVLGQKRNSRIIDLLKLVGLEDRVVSSVEDYCQRKNSIREIDYVRVKEKLNVYIEESRNELDKICSL